MLNYKPVTNLLSKGGNSKTDKNEFQTYNLSLSPYNYNSKGVNICPKASKGCALACARINKTNFYLYNKQMFLFQLANEINKATDKANKKGQKIALRLNTFSDLDFVYLLKKYCEVDLLNDDFYKNVIVYDYTAILGKVKKYLGTRYHLTLSRKEDNEQDIIEALNAGGNVSVVFLDELPKTYKGFKVVDGDVTDLEMTKFKNVVLGLRAKGKEAKNDTSGFIVR